MRWLLLLCTVSWLGCSQARTPATTETAAPEPVSSRYGLRPPKRLGDTRPLSSYEIPEAGLATPAPEMGPVSTLPKPQPVTTTRREPSDEDGSEEPGDEATAEATPEPLAEASPARLPTALGFHQALETAGVASGKQSELERRQRILEGYEKRFILCDTDQDGRLSEEERVRGFQYLLEHRPVFRSRVDRNQDGTISKSEHDFAQTRFMKHPPRFKD